MKESEIIKYIKNHEIMFIKKIDIDYKFKDGTNLIHKASLYGFMDLVLYLINKKSVSILDISAGKYGSTPIFFTIYNHCYGVMNLILKVLEIEKKKIREVNKVNIPILHICVKLDDILAFIILIANGARLDLLDRKSRNVYDYAKEKKKFRFVLFLDKLYKENNINNNLGNDDMISNYSHILRTKKSFLMKIFTLEYDFLIITLGVLTNAVILFKYPSLCYFIAPFSLIKNRRLIGNKMFVFVNVLYTSNYVVFMYLSYRNRYVLSLVIAYYLMMIKLMTGCKLKNRAEVRFSEAKNTINNLLNKENLFLTTFCYLCWQEKNENTTHCHICKTCIDHHDHHCRYLGICISKENVFWFELYLYTTFVVLLFLPNVKFFTDCKNIYSLIGLFVILQIMARISMMFESKSKVK